MLNTNQPTTTVLQVPPCSQDRPRPQGSYAPSIPVSVVVSEVVSSLELESLSTSDVTSDSPSIDPLSLVPASPDSSVVLPPSLVDSPTSSSRSGSGPRSSKQPSRARLESNEQVKARRRMA